jgi:hypothetical protein
MAPWPPIARKPALAVTVSEPVGAFVDEHEALADLRAAVHMVLVPIANITEPAGVPDDEDTVAL